LNMPMALARTRVVRNSFILAAIVWACGAVLFVLDTDGLGVPYSAHCAPLGDIGRQIAKGSFAISPMTLGVLVIAALGLAFPPSARITQALFFWVSLPV
jgi:hypothetical protein